MTSKTGTRRFSFSLQRFEAYALAVGLVAALTGLIYLIGRDVLGEA
jgi:hypothetical protein